ncbi:PIG-L family deacetylase [Nocardioides sp. GCM10027113]|uniref:PIG-L family deacetylase n=1 Tax=unclassified Nocardioides TaxID=2615069 RepID=UPI00361B0BDA
MSTTLPSTPAPVRVPALLGEPVDERGRLVHADDPAAQAALALCRLEAALGRDGHRPVDLVRLRVLVPEPDLVGDVAEVLTERLEEIGARADLEVVEVPALALPGQLVALEPVVRRPGRLLVVVAHPDDEAFGCGSVIAHATAHGLRSTVVCATRGELGEPAPGSGLTREELPAVRERELRSACALLGAERVELLGYRDSGVSGAPVPGSLAAADPTELRDRVATIVDEVRPDVVVTLDAGDGHRDHAAVRDATLAALDVVEHRPAATYLHCLVRSVMAAFTGDPTLGTPDEDVTALVDVADVLDLRWRAIRAHASQVPPYDAMDEPLQHAFLAVDRLRRVDPPWPGGPVADTWLPRPPEALRPSGPPPPSQTPPGPPDRRPHTTEGSTMTLTSSPTTSPGSAPGSAQSLRGLCGGRVHLPGDPAYDQVRQPWNLAVDQRPAAVALPHTVDEVVEVVRAAAAAGLRVAPQSTGHGAGPLAGADLSDVVLLRLSGLTGVEVDAAAGTARVVGGTEWQDVVAAAAPHGYTALHGSAPDVAVAGYALNGGMSFYGRAHGLAVNSVRAVEVVTAEGVLLRADAHQHADLFWAVRGGAGNLGVVVALEIDLLPLPDVYAGMLLWDRKHALAVTRTWAAWTRDLPESVTTSLRVMSFPPLPELPPFLSGRQLVVIDGAVLEDDERAAELLAPLRALEPEMDTFGRGPVTDVLAMHMDPPAPTPAASDHALLAEVTGETVETLLAHVGHGTASPLLFAELRHLGGAFARRAEHGGALSALSGEYALYAIGVAPTPEVGAVVQEAAADLVRALAPWSVPAFAPTFTDNPVDASSFFDGEDWARLAHLRAAYDPHRRMVANHRL